MAVMLLPQETAPRVVHVVPPLSPGAGHHLQGPPLCPHLRTSQVEL